MVKLDSKTFEGEEFEYILRKCMKKSRILEWDMGKLSTKMMNDPQGNKTEIFWVDFTTEQKSVVNMQLHSAYTVIKEDQTTKSNVLNKHWTGLVNNNPL